MSEFVTITPEEAMELIKESPDVVILDIRSKKDYLKEHVPGAMNLDYDGHQFQKRQTGLIKKKYTSSIVNQELEGVISWKK